MKQKALESLQILNDFIGDIVTSSQYLKMFESSGFRKQATFKVCRLSIRMALSHLILTLYKWIEFYNKYKSVIPKDIRPVCMELKKKIENKGIWNFRNHVIGHIWSDELKRPLLHKEIEDALGNIMGDDEEKFMLWINNPENNNYPETVISIIEKTRDRIREEFSLS